MCEKSSDFIHPEAETSSASAGEISVDQQSEVSRQRSVPAVQCEFRRVGVGLGVGVGEGEGEGGEKWVRELFRSTREKCVIMVGLSPANLQTQYGHPLRDLIRTLRYPKWRRMILRVVFLDSSAGYLEYREALADGRDSDYLKQIWPELEQLGRGRDSIPFEVVPWVEVRERSSGTLAELEAFFEGNESARKVLEEEVAATAARRGLTAEAERRFILEETAVVKEVLPTAVKVLLLYAGRYLRVWREVLGPCGYFGPRLELVQYRASER